MDDADKRILIVDDDPLTVQILDRVLGKSGYQCTSAGNAREARACLKEHAFSLVFCDVNMPGESGLNLAMHILSHHRSTAVIMVTAVDDVKMAETTLEMGAYGYIIKPFRQNEVLISVFNAFRRRQLEIEHNRNEDLLEKRVSLRTLELTRAVARLKEADQHLRLSHEELIQRLASASEFGGGESACHVQRVGHFCALLAQKLGIASEHREVIRLASAMHDVGKIGTPDTILFKPGKLTASEFEIVKYHAEIGHRILSGSKTKLLQTSALIAWTHHEKVDGAGYPRGLAGDAIPVEGRITAIADAFDAMTSKRTYRPAFSPKTALKMLSDGRGTAYDPVILDHFLAAKEEVLRIREKYSDR